jgi:hypothetical protein
MTMLALLPQVRAVLVGTYEHLTSIISGSYDATVRLWDLR